MSPNRARPYPGRRGGDRLRNDDDHRGDGDRTEPPTSCLRFEYRSAGTLTNGAELDVDRAECPGYEPLAGKSRRSRYDGISFVRGPVTPGELSGSGAPLNRVPMASSDAA